MGHHDRSFLEKSEVSKPHTAGIGFQSCLQSCQQYCFHGQQCSCPNPPWLQQMLLAFLAPVGPGYKQHVNGYLEIDASILAALEVRCNM